MKFKITIALFFLFLFYFHTQAQVLPIWNSSLYPSVGDDWLVKSIRTKAAILQSKDGKDLILYNGLLKRVFRLLPNLACTDFSNLRTGRQLLRTVKEEARLTINGKVYHVGGLGGLKEKAYLLKEWVEHMTTSPEDFRYISFRTQPIQTRINWKNVFWASQRTGGTGKRISFLFRSDLPELAGLEVNINYELYDGVPLIVKSLSINNTGDKIFTINRVVNEVLAMVEEESAVEGEFAQMKTPQGMYVETNYAFNNSMRYAQSDQTTHWKPDSGYTSQVHYRYLTPALLEVYPAQVTDIQLRPKEVFNSVRSHELLMDSYDRESRGLAIRKMYAVVAPWTTANPIFMHVVSRNDQDVYTAIDQCAETGYEALIVSFRSHLQMHEQSEENLTKWKRMADYAHRKNVKIGAYSLFSSRKISDEDDVIDPKTNKPGGALFGNAPCFGSKWGLKYRDEVKNFFVRTGFDIWENDGPYAGDLCASGNHPGHRGLGDSQWMQMEIQKELYHWLNEHGIYINSPDWYFLDGAHKTGLGYREVNFNMSREQQKILNRQNIYDGTWEKMPSMSWGFVPLTAYGNADADATIEPLVDHLRDYEQLMMQYYGAGIQACYRGPRLFDTNQTKQLVINTVKWYKKYRDILNADIIHLRRADGRDWDGILHVNPKLNSKGLMILYNPLKETIKRTIRVPLYYTGLTDVVKVREKEGKSVINRLNRDFTTDISFTIPSESYTWFVFE
ncbi:alpha-galactosidase [Pedobacter sp. AW31-3R]|uniref:alpha-galactosidase n=1 Tax=Pedobacter sp. AW31-3R TaxID=3445781 RepID=UPI003FA156E2